MKSSWPISVSPPKVKSLGGHPLLVFSLSNPAEISVHSGYKLTNQTVLAPFFWNPKIDFTPPPFPSSNPPQQSETLNWKLKTENAIWIEWFKSRFSFQFSVFSFQFHFAGGGVKCEIYFWISEKRRQDCLVCKFVPGSTLISAGFESENQKWMAAKRFHFWGWNWNRSARFHFQFHFRLCADTTGYPSPSKWNWKLKTENWKRDLNHTNYNAILLWSRSYE